MIKRILLIITVVVMLLPFASCGAKPALTDYVVTYGAGEKKAAELLVEKIKEKTGIALELMAENAVNSDLVISVNADEVGNFEGTLGFDDFTVYTEGKGLHVVGGSDYATKTAITRLVKLMSANPAEFDVAKLSLSYALPSREEYIQNPEKLALHWESDFETPSWMLDFEEKYRAMTDVDGRLISCLHRGEAVYYPENSIEGIISAIYMGGDMIEIDPRLTKDGVFVLMHDETLGRTTDVYSKVGKNGLPSTVNISDWTYEQLMQLNLKDASGNVTPYKIPTLEEAIKVSANRIFIRLDVKGPTGSDLPFWDFEKDIWPLLEKYNCHSTVLYTWQKFFRADSFKLVKKYRDLSEKASGKAMLGFLNNKTTADDALKVIENHDLAYAMRLTFNLSEFGYNTFLSENKDRLDGFKGKIRIYADVHNTNAKYPQNKESYELYETLYNAGINIQLADKSLLICKYVAENFTATK